MSLCDHFGSVNVKAMSPPVVQETVNITLRDERASKQISRLSYYNKEPDRS